MPELPEVETVRRIVTPQIAGQSIVSVEVLNPQVIAHPDSEAFAAVLTKQNIRFTSRRGKFLVLHMDSGDRLILHLRMTGQLLVTPPDFPAEKHTHLILRLSGGNEVRYIDVRRFGRFWYLKQGESDSTAGMDKLGIEPSDAKLTSAYLKEKSGKRGKAIKEMLHEQSIVAGIGNIYSDEILFAAGIYPEKKCRDMCDDEWERLAKEIPKIISWAIEANETTAEEYLKGKGREYRNTPYLRVYGHAGKPCPTCGTLLKKITIGGRSSTYCPVCQKK